MSEYFTEFKIFVICYALGFFLTLYKTRARSKKRPILLLTLYLVYVIFQSYTLTDFFPFSAFQHESYPVEKSMKYARISAVQEDGSRILLPLNLLPVMEQGRLKHFVKRAVQEPEAAQVLANAYSKAAQAKPGHPALAEVSFEQWKWDFLNDPGDKNLGFKIKAVSAKPEAANV
jgi:hypothetical protein